MKSVLLFIMGLIFLFLAYDPIVRYLTNTYKKQICVEEFCIEKPKDWIPIVVKRKGQTYMYDTFINNDMSLSKLHFEDYDNGIVLTKEEYKIVFRKLKLKNGISPQLVKYTLKDNIYYKMKKKDVILIVFPKLHLGFNLGFNNILIDDTKAEELLKKVDYLVEYFILTSTRNIK